MLAQRQAHAGEQARQPIAELAFEPRQPHRAAHHHHVGRERSQALADLVRLEIGRQQHHVVGECVQVVGEHRDVGGVVRAADPRDPCDAA